MTFRSLKIEAEQYGKDKGKLKAEICIAADGCRTYLDLPDDVGEKILQLAKEAIIDAVEKTSNDFIFELTTAIPERMTLANTQ